MDFDPFAKNLLVSDESVWMWSLCSAEKISDRDGMHLKFEDEAKRRNFQREIPKQRKNQREEKPPSSVIALLTRFLIGFSLVFGVWRGQRGRLLVCSKDRRLFGSWIRGCIELNDCGNPDCASVCRHLKANGQPAHTHTGTVLEVSSWITSFRLCCIITSSAVINSDVPTEMRRSVLHCSTHTQKHTVIPL